jgi:hypothetical protein
MANPATAAQVDTVLKGLMHKDMRIQCRAFGLSPAGNRDTLFERLREHMLATGDW